MHIKNPLRQGKFIFTLPKSPVKSIDFPGKAYRKEGYLFTYNEGVLYS